jgi:fumarate reductase subunit C
MTTKRKPLRPMMRPPGGKSCRFIASMVREGTAVVPWFSIVLIYGLFALKHGAESWAGYVGFLQNPVVVILNLITLARAAAQKPGLSWRRKPPISLLKAKKWGQSR